MKQGIMLAALTVMSLDVMADTVPGMVVSKTDGSAVSVAISDVRSIKYADGNMVISKTDNSKQVIGLDDVSSVEFSDISTAIKTIVGAGSKVMTITDLGGRIVYSGDANGYNTDASLHGIYIITVDGKSHKVVIK